MERTCATEFNVRKPNYLSLNYTLASRSQTFILIVWFHHWFISIFELHVPTREEKERHPAVTKRMIEWVRKRGGINKMTVELTSLTGPLTFLMIDRVGSSRNSTLTWITFPVFPVLPRTRLTLASLTGWSYSQKIKIGGKSGREERRQKGRKEWMRKQSTTKKQERGRGRGRGKEWDEQDLISSLSWWQKEGEGRMGRGWAYHSLSWLGGSTAPSPRGAQPHKKQKWLIFNRHFQSNSHLPNKRRVSGNRCPEDAEQTHHSLEYEDREVSTFLGETISCDHCV